MGSAAVMSHAPAFQYKHELASRLRATQLSTLTHVRVPDGLKSAPYWFPATRSVSLAVIGS